METYTKFGAGTLGGNMPRSILDASALSEELRVDAPVIPVNVLGGKVSNFIEI